MMLGNLTERILNFLRSEGEPPVEIGHPWSEDTEVEQVTPEERARLVQLLIDNSALADR